jgi:two-component system chemotaxis response regulator CheY
MKLKALVVDDSRIVRTMIMQSLRKTGLAEFDFVEAEDGYDALGKLDFDKTSIVFADVNMSDMSSREFVEKIRADRKADRIPIIMVINGKNTDSIIAVLDRAGADAFIHKPFTISELTHTLKDLIGRIGNGSRLTGSVQ